MESSKYNLKLDASESGMVAQIFNLSIWEGEAGRALWVWDQPRLHTEFQDHQDYKDILTRSEKKKKKQEEQKEEKEGEDEEEEDDEKNEEEDEEEEDDDEEEKKEEDEDEE